MSEQSSTDQLQARSLRDYVDRVTARTLAGCTECGKCFEACPMPAYSKGLAEQPGSKVVPGVLEVLRARPGSAEALEWIGLCTQSARCIPACPEGVNPMLMLRIARFRALGSLGDDPQLTRGEDPQYFRRIHAFSHLQLSEEEVDTWQR